MVNMQRVKQQCEDLQNKFAEAAEELNAMIKEATEQKDWDWRRELSVVEASLLAAKEKLERAAGPKQL
jgi:hypothetical protein